jgi:UDP-GlcNAc:undecaprenyl-phosphate GlcNAc-1-phosphate transferase
MSGLAQSFLVALSLTFGATPLVLGLARRFGALALPRPRDVHTVPVAQWGGVAIWFGVIATVGLPLIARHLKGAAWTAEDTAISGALLGGTLLALVGLLDDVCDLRPRHQASAILLAGFIAVCCGVRVEAVRVPGIPGLSFLEGTWHLPFPIGAALSMAWIFVVTKTVDAIDGLDGLAAGVSALAALTIGTAFVVQTGDANASLAILPAAVAGASMGFLPSNAFPAVIFMGTGGAQFLGYMLATATLTSLLHQATPRHTVVAVLALGLPILDFAFVVFRRMASGAPITQADRRHVHHRLLDRGFTHPQAVYRVYAYTAIFCAAGLALAWAR